MTSASAVDLTAGGDGHRSVQDTDVLVENEGIQMRIDVRNIEVEEFRIDRELEARASTAIPNLPMFAAAIYGRVCIVAELMARDATFCFDSTALENIVVMEFVSKDNQVLAYMIENCTAHS
ncbi:Aste57867_1079 [Globisporangium polare]